MTERASLPDQVVQKAALGRIHHHYIDLERSDMANARALIRALAAEILRLRADGEKVDKEG